MSCLLFDPFIYFQIFSSLIITRHFERNQFSWNISLIIYIYPLPRSLPFSKRNIFSLTQISPQSDFNFISFYILNPVVQSVWYSCHSHFCAFVPYNPSAYLVGLFPYIVYKTSIHFHDVFLEHNIQKWPLLFHTCLFHWQKDYEKLLNVKLISHIQKWALVKLTFQLMNDPLLKEVSPSPYRSESSGTVLLPY